ncbi:MAG: hypothetical protein II370_07000, partial [Clostridia bacterium]|nr:hypothetical protein [Clostridia bacterium]
LRSLRSLEDDSREGGAFAVMFERSETSAKARKVFARILRSLCSLKDDRARGAFAVMFERSETSAKALKSFARILRSLCSLKDDRARGVLSCHS